MVVLYFLGGGWITMGGLSSEVVKADCIIVPGARVFADGSLGPSMQARANRAIGLYRQGWARAIIFTGGRGASGAVESESCREYAVVRGVKREHVFVESESHDTWENFLFARRVMREQGFQSCLITTDAFHARRCLMLARDFGIPAHSVPTYEGPASRRPTSWLYYTTRECFSMMMYGYERYTRIRPD